MLMYQVHKDEPPIVLLFSSLFSALDYLRFNGKNGTVGQFKVDALPERATAWHASGVRAVALDRCPRCPQFVQISLAGLVKWTTEDFMKVWAHHRATRFVFSESRIRSAMKHLTAKSPAAAQTDYEYIRDHFDCSVPYLHQLIGLLAGAQGDEPAKAFAMERLKEFGPPFDAPLEFSANLVATATVGMMASFGIITLGLESK